MIVLSSSSVTTFGIELVAGLFQLPPDIVASQIPMVAPFPTSPAEIAHRKIVDDLLSTESDVWANKPGYMLEEDVDSKIVNDKMKILESDLPSSEEEEKPYKPATYGEITTVGARQLYYHMGMKGGYKISCSNEKDDGGAHSENNENAKNNAADMETSGKIVFCDMGSGVGRYVPSLLVANCTKATSIFHPFLTQNF